MAHPVIEQLFLIEVVWFMYLRGTQKKDKCEDTEDDVDTNTLDDYVKS